MSGPLHPGVQAKVLSGTPTAAGTTSASVSVQSDSALVSLWAASVTGTLTVSVYAETAPGKEVLLFTFPVVSAASSSLLLRRASITTSSVRVKATYTDACDYEVFVRAIDSGVSDTRIVGAGTLRMSKASITTGAGQLLVASALTDRAGIIVRNWSSSGDLYLGATAGEATTANGYPVGPRESLSIDLAAGQALYGTASAGTLDIRISEAGG